MKTIIFFLCMFSINTLFGQTRLDKSIIRLKGIYSNINTYSEKGHYIYTSKSNNEPEKIISEGNHILYFDNINKKVKISAKLINNYSAILDSNFYNFSCKIDDRDNNIFLPITKINDKQEDILTTINRHTFSFFASNLELNYFAKKLFEDTIKIIVNKEKLKKIKCYKLVRKYNIPISEKIIEYEKKERHIWDSLGMGKNYDNISKRVSDIYSIEETYWFRKTDGMLLKETQIIVLKYVDTGNYIMKTERIFDPKLNPILPPKIFEN